MPEWDSRVQEHDNLEHARSMRIHAGLLKPFLADAVDTVVYLIKKGSSVPLNYGIPEEAWTEKKVKLNCHAPLPKYMKMVLR